MMRSNKFFRACSSAAQAILSFYRAVLSPDHGVVGVVFKRTLPAGFISSGCRFTPSCSAYAQDAIRQYGLGRGVMVSCGRIFRCHPWSSGGYDPIKNA